MDNRTEPFVLIVIPTWNRSEDLIECIRSIMRQNYRNFDIVVVDNCSEDNTAARLKDEFPDVHLIQLDKNRGASYATNKGFEFALDQGAELILRLDSDTIVDEKYLYHLVHSITKTPKAEIVSGKIYSYYKPEDIWFTGGHINWWNLSTVYIDLKNDNDGIDEQPIEVDLIPSTGMLISRRALDVLSGFDKDYLVYYEDFDFCLRAIKSDMKLLYVEQAKLWHKVYSHKNTAWIAKQWNKSKMIYFRKHARNKGHKLFLIFYAFSYAIFRSISKAEDRGNRGPLIATLRGLIEGLFSPLTDASGPNQI